MGHVCNLKLNWKQALLVSNSDVSKTRLGLNKNVNCSLSLSLHLSISLFLAHTLQLNTILYKNLSSLGKDKLNKYKGWLTAFFQFVTFWCSVNLSLTILNKFLNRLS